MPIRYKVNIIAALKEAGYSTYKIKKRKAIRGSYFTKIPK